MMKKIKIVTESAKQVLLGKKIPKRGRYGYDDDGGYGGHGDRRSGR